MLVRLEVVGRRVNRDQRGACGDVREGVFDRKVMLTAEAKSNDQALTRDSKKVKRKFDL